jgi:3-phenylpropionate/trans-cinnamate dioxygenase ferredoxin component
MPISVIDYRKLGQSAQLQDNSVNPYYLDERKQRVSVARIGDKLFAFDDLCTHEGCQLSAGILTGTTLMCPCHGSQFDVASGAVLRGPAKRSLTTYEVREQNGEIEVRL